MALSREIDAIQPVTIRWKSDWIQLSRVRFHNPPVHFQDFSQIRQLNKILDRFDDSESNAAPRRESYGKRLTPSSARLWHCDSGNMIANKKTKKQKKKNKFR